MTSRAQRVQRVDGVLRRLGLAEHVAGADAQDQVRRPARGSDGGLLDERDPAGEPAGRRAVPAPGEVGAAEVDTGAGRAGDRGEDAEHQLTPAAAEVEHRGRTCPGEPADEARGPGLGQGAVEGEAGKARRESSSVIAATLGPLGPTRTIHYSLIADERGGALGDRVHRCDGVGGHE